MGGWADGRGLGTGAWAEQALDEVERSKVVAQLSRPRTATPHAHHKVEMRFPSMLPGARATDLFEAREGTAIRCAFGAADTPLPSWRVCVERKRASDRPLDAERWRLAAARSYQASTCPLYTRSQL